MKVFKLSTLALTGAAVAFVVACEGTNVPQEVSDAAINNDIASSSGDAVGSALSAMLANESSTGLNVKAPLMASATGNSADVTWSGTRTCYNANDVVVNNCAPLSSVRKIIAHVTANGTNSGTSTTEGGATINWTGVAHRVLDDTLVRNYSTGASPTEQSRTHTAVGTAHDTATFADVDAGASRLIAADVIDSVQALQWNLPHSQNPWPASGSLKRVGSVHVVAETENQSFTRDVTLTVSVDFPADAQGNVALHVNSKTCNLNLVTRKVTDCQ